MNRHPQLQGFHLLEVLVVLVIVTIMSQWMIMNYQSFLARGKRQAAASELYALASALEEFAMLHGGYRHATFADLKVSELVVRHQYQLRLEKIEDQYFKIAALPVGNQAQVDGDCGKLMLTSTGVKSVSGKKSVDECWQA